MWTKFNSEESEKAEKFRDTFVKDFFVTFKDAYAKLKKNFKPSFKNNKENKDDK